MTDQNALQERRLRAAIESVFRRTHGRDMTSEERRLFGLTQKGNGAFRTGMTQKPSGADRTGNLDDKRRA